MQPEAELPFVTAKEIADFVFCQRSWALHREGALLSDDARARLEAGNDFQDQKDSVVAIALRCQAAAKRASKLMWIAVILLLIGVAAWVAYLLSQR
jgi:hypothetical protein